MDKSVAMLGAGAYGTAMAQLLAKNGFTVKLWCHEQEVADSIKQSRINSLYMPGVNLHASIEPTTNIAEVICDVSYVFQAIPVAFLRSVIQKTVPCFSKDQVWVSLSKGIEKDSLMVPTQVIQDLFNFQVATIALSGPSFAQDIMKEQITAVTLGSEDCEHGRVVQNMLANNYFRPYISLDTIGVQFGAALKNVIALGVGILEGAGYSDNAQAFLMTRGLYEMSYITKLCGGKQETVYGLSGVGDLMLTCSGTLSKNKKLGIMIGSGKNLEQCKQEFPTMPEGINTLQAVQQIITKHQLDVPIFNGIYNVIYGGLSVENFLKDLMNRPLEVECE